MGERCNGYCFLLSPNQEQTARLHRNNKAQDEQRQKTLSTTQVCFSSFGFSTGTTRRGWLSIDLAGSPDLCTIQKSFLKDNSSACCMTTTNKTTGWQRETGECVNFKMQDRNWKCVRQSKEMRYDNHVTLQSHLGLIWIQDIWNDTSTRVNGARVYSSCSFVWTRVANLAG